MNNRGRSTGTPKTGGRQKGTPNKSTSAIRDSLQSIIENNITRLQSDLDSLKPAERVKALTEICKYVVPQLKAVELSSSEELRPVILQLGSGINPEQD